MKIIWNSSQGRNRCHNSDYGIFCNYSNYYIFMIGDAKEEIESNHFIKYILEFIKNNLNPENPDILNTLKYAKKSYVETEGIPKKLPGQMASLHILIVEKNSLHTKSFNLGDCRFGYKKDNKWE